ncbi:hypothetical protein [Halobellus rufus]|uniref:hypothetical protein n=1 Tax=Halobellus rufus TaxID=1448860 RepID=UPI0006784DAC|nr:hypothetical protein [Halobellus rufus]
MDVSEDELIGEPSEEVPTIDPDGENCHGKRTEKRDGETIFVGYCGAWPGKGTDHVGEGRCSKHAGNAGAPEGNDNAEGNDGGAPDGNRNASTHDLYTDQNKFYQEVATDSLRTLCDKIYEGYVAKFREVTGEPHAGEEARLSQIAINHIKIIHGDNWSTDRPDTLDSGNALVDRETRIKTTEHEAREEHRYSEAAVAKAQRYLRKEDRKWLKEMGLLGADIDVSIEGQVDHDHTHGLDEETREMIEDLGEDLKE